MHRDISVSLSPDGIQKAIDEVLKLQKRLNGDRMDNAIFDISTRIMGKAGEIYGPSVRVTTEPAAKGRDVVASGKAVMFLEFGAGTQTDVGHPYAANAPAEIRPGSYSETHAQMFSSTNEDGNGYWVFGGKVYHYVMPRRALYEAVNYVAPDIAEIVKEKFER